MSERITIKDIAKALSIHHSTVSRALRNDSRVNDDTRKKVLLYARKHGYQTNMVARELRGVKRNTVAVIVPNINHHFFSNIVSSFTDIASDNDFVVSVFQTNESIEREKNIIDTIIQNNFSGVIASISMESDDTSHFNKLIEYGIPLVMYDRVSSSCNTPKVVINNTEIIKEAVDIIINKGNKRIAYITGPTHLNVFRERQIGYKESIAKHNLDYKNLIILNSGFTIDDGVVVAKKLFSENIKPDAIICDSSNLAYGLIKELKAKGINIPSEVSLIVFGENPSLEIIEPPITSIVQPCKDIAETVFKLLIDRIEQEEIEQVEIITLSAKIIMRESV